MYWVKLFDIYPDCVDLIDNINYDGIINEISKFLNVGEYKRTSKSTFGNQVYLDKNYSTDEEVIIMDGNEYSELLKSILRILAYRVTYELIAKSKIIKHFLTLLDRTKESLKSLKSEDNCKYKNSNRGIEK